MFEPTVVAGLDGCQTQLLYFTSSSLSADDGTVWFLSDRDGSPNIYAQRGDAVMQYSFNRGGIMYAYVYFDGTPHRGLSKASPCLDPVSGTVYYIQDDVILKSDGQTVTPLASVRNGETTAFTHVSADGRLLCVPTTDGRALAWESNAVLYSDSTRVDRRVLAEHLCSYLNIYDTATGALLRRETVPDCWITHVQFCPADPNLILYNYEWTSVDCGFRRMHLFDGRRHYALRQPDALCRGGDWTCHEMWSRDGSMIYYHGGYEGGYYIGRVDPASVLAGSRPDYTEIRLPADYSSYGHFTEGEGGLLVTDGYYRENGGEDGSAYISVVQPDWKAGKTVWTPLCRHGSGWGSQDAHPHPIFNHRGDAVYFTSDADGTLKAYRVPCKIGR